MRLFYNGIREFNLKIGFKHNEDLKNACLVLFFTEITDSTKIINQNNSSKMKRFQQIVHDLRSPLNQIIILSEHSRELTDLL